MNTVRSCAELQMYRFDPQAGWDRAPDPSLNSPQTLVLVFAASGYADNPAPIDTLRNKYPNSKIIGCSSAGEILNDRVHDDSLVVAVRRFEHTQLRDAWAEIDSPSGAREAGHTIGRELAADGLRYAFVVSDGLTGNGSELVRGLNESLPPGVTVTGGLSGDGPRFKRTWVLLNGSLNSGCVAAIGFFGSRLRVGHGSRGGWDAFGPTRLITRSEGNVLYELDGRPALALYKEYLGERASELPSSALLFPLSVRPASDASKCLVRTILSVDESNQSMTFAGEMPQGSTAQLMCANFDRIIAAAGDSSLTALGRMGQAPRSAGLAIAISCVGRRIILGERAEEELEATCESLGAGDQQIGFYSYGELSPFVSGPCDLHNQTMTITTLSE